MSLGQILQIKYSRNIITRQVDPNLSSYGVLSFQGCLTRNMQGCTNHGVDINIDGLEVARLLLK
jgi:hypothetical protein